jgi:ABC-type Fe3+ transport system permease subunit
MIISAALLLLPVYNIISLSFAGKDGSAGMLENYAMIFSGRYYYRSVLNSFIVSIAAPVLALMIGVPAAYIVSRYDIWGRGLVKTAVVLTFVSPPFIGSYSWVILLGRKGVLTQFFGELGISLPSITTGALLVFIASFTDLGTPIILGEQFRVLPVLMYGEFVNDFGGAAGAGAVADCQNRDFRIPEIERSGAGGRVHVPEL